MKTLDLFAEQAYVPRCDADLPLNEQARFHFRLLTADQEAFVRDLSRVQGSATAMIAILDLALTRLENISTPRGEPLILARDLKAPKVGGFEHPWVRAAIDPLPGQIRDEVAAHILKLGNAAEADTKNS